MNKPIFLLGGIDLEMHTIEELLKEHHYVANESYFNHNLTWGAKLSAYKEIIEKYPESHFIGVELINDLNLQENYAEVDHHNEKSDFPSSLEQVASHLNVKLNRAQQLVAANDKGYIPALKAMGASQAEIDDIRRKDRFYQGVTNEDEKLAEKAIKEDLMIDKGITVIESKTSKFSPITDRMYGRTEQLLIYTSEELCYYGKDTWRLVEKFQHLIDNGCAFYGGGDDGFFGFTEKPTCDETTKQLKSKILDVLCMYSKHIFLFPFRWDFLNKDTSLDDVSFNERCKLTKWKEFLNDNKSWEKSSNAFIEEASDFNEYTYFYDFVREALFDEPTKERDGLESEKCEEKEAKKLLWHFNYSLDSKAKYKITIRTGESSMKTYSLELSRVFLHVFSNGVGLLSFQCHNKDYKEKEDILKINEYGRRLYPQFLSVDKPTLIDGAKDSFLAEKIRLVIGSNNVDEFEEDFIAYNDINNVKKNPFRLPNFILNLLGKEHFSCSKERVDKERICLTPLLDDRMFVISWYTNQKLIDKLTHKPKKSANEVNYAYYSNEFWYKYVFVDSNFCTCCNKNMLRRENKMHTYERFSDTGTLYGITRYSLTCLTGSGYFGEVIIPSHVMGVYYQMVVLCLMQRASVLKYSNEVSRISANVRENHEEIESINESYLKFINKMYFREITAFDQGVELYDKMQECMRIEKEVKDLNREIDEIYQFASLAAEKRQNNQIKWLTILGVIFLPPSLIAGFLGMNTLPKNNYFPDSFGELMGELLAFRGYAPFWWSMAVLVVLSCITILLGFLWRKYRVNRRLCKVKCLKRLCQFFTIKE